MAAEVVRLDGAALRRWGRAALAALEQHREELDALNVFPVADADTGTNLTLTVAEALAAADGLPEHAPVHEVGRALARGALVGARGNSGVIVGQYLGALLRRLLAGPADADDVAVPVEGLVEALREASDAGYRAVARPVEGTVLTVARAAAHAAQAAAGPGVHPAPTTAAALTAAVHEGYRALARTPHQLPELRDAGVLDAGAWGLVLLLETLLPYVGGVEGANGPEGLRRGPSGTACARPGEPQGDAVTPRGAVTHGEDAVTHGTGAFEVMYVVTATGVAAEDLGDERVAAALRQRLAAVGESVAVVGGEGLWQAHVHTDRPLDALVLPTAAGARVTQVRVRHLATQAGVHGLHRPSLGLVAVTAAPRLVADLAQVGAVVVLVQDGSAGGELRRAIEDTGASEVLVLAAAGLVEGGAAAGGNCPPAAPAVDLLADLSEVQVVVGAATLASLDRTSPAAELRAQVVQAVRRVRSDVVDGLPDGGTVAPGPSRPPVAGPGHAGGAEDVGGERHAGAVVEAATALLAGGGTLLTALLSRDTAPDVGDALRRLAEVRPGAEVVVLESGAPGTAVVLGVE